MTLSIFALACKMAVLLIAADAIKLLINYQIDYYLLNYFQRMAENSDKFFKLSLWSSIHRVI